MLYVILFIMAVLILFLIVKVCLMKKSIKEISSGFSRIVKEDTNSVIGISSRDKDIRHLTENINLSLKEMRNNKLTYDHGNTELKNAITNISHDIRTPLTAICGYLDMLKKTDDSKKREHYIEIMTERANMMKHLTEELFCYSLIMSEDAETETENVYVNQLLAESISGFYPALKEKNIEPSITITDVRVERTLNKQALSRVFSNILGNAVKYSDGDLEIVMTDTGIITFTNTAKKLSPIETGQLFDRFYTVENAHHSTGLGLSIARTLVERMGGTITAKYSDQKLTITIML